MPWDITIRRADHEPLGDAATVRERIAAALPGVQFYSESGADHLAAARAAGVELPDVLREHFETCGTSEKADFEGDEYSIQLYGLEDQPLCELHASVRGNGDPIPALAALCCPNRWIVIDDTSGKPVDLAAGDATAWDSFRAYVGRAVHAVMSAEDDSE